MSADDPVSPGKNGQGEAPRGNGQTEAVTQRVEGAVEYADAAHDRIDDLAAQVDKLAAKFDREIKQRDDKIRQQSQRIDELQRRTDMLRLVEQADHADGPQRSRALLQHLRRKARSDPDEPDIASIGADSAKEALHHPNVDRTTIYSDMQRVVRLVDDRDLCWYADGELWLDLRQQDLSSVEAPQQDRSGYGVETGSNGGDT